ncbi:MAG: hypothetical protein KDB23_18780 [Planctomycetales bacterium]|nr:hypothetical protein [Planctomycetales bacterium]
MIPYTTIPFVSALFLVAVGVLIGHLIWNRFRDEQEHVTRRLRGRAKSLAETLEVTSAESNQLAAKLSSTEGDIAQLRQELEQNRAAVEAANRAVEVAEKQLAHERQARIDLTACLEDEQQQRREQQTTANDESKQFEDRNRELLHRLAATESKRDELSGQNEHLQHQLAAQSAELNATKQQLKAATHQLNTAEDTMDSASAEIQALRKRYAALEQAKHKTEQEQQSLAAQVETLTDAVEAARVDSQHQLQAAHGFQQQIEQAAAQLRSAEQQRNLDAQRITELEQTLASQAAQIERITADKSHHAAVIAATNRELTQAQADYQGLQQQYQELHREYQALQTHSQKVTEKLAATESYAQQTGEGLADARQELLTYESQAADMSRDLESLASRLRQEAERRHRLEQEIEAGRQREEELTRTRDRLETELTATHSALIELENSWHAKFANAEQAWRVLSERQIAELTIQQTEHNEQAAQLADLAARHDALLAQERQTQEVVLSLNQDLQSARDKIKRWKTEYRELQQQVESDQEELNQLRPLRSQFIALCTTADEDKLQIDQLSLELKQQTDSMSSLLTEMETLREQLDEALADHDRDGQLMAEYRAEADELANELRLERDHRNAAEESLTATRNKLVSVRRDLERLELVEDQMIEREAESKQLLEELKLVRKARDQAVEAEASTRQIVAELREELNDRLDAVAVLRRDKEAFLGQLEHERRLRTQATEALEQSEARLAKIRAEVDALTERQARSAHRCGELEQALAEAQQQGRTHERLAHEFQLKYEAVAVQMEEMQTMRRGQRRRLNNLPSEATADLRGAFSFRDMRIREQHVRDEDDAKLIRDTKLGAIYESMPSRIDDLTRIRGLNDDTAARLNQLGIYTFRQIMEWSESTIAELSTELALADTITKHDWPGIARQLYHDAERSAA